MNNFEFLKTVDKNLYEIIIDAEKLYRDEYFEQCIGQTRRFAENVCKNVLGKNRTCEKTFDDMLATLKDKSSNAEQEKEFIDDLYFLKREGNATVHAFSVKKDGIVALECLQRSFELAINYAVYYMKSKSSLLKLRYDTELLVTGKRTKSSLKEKYEAEKSKTKRTKNSKKTSKTPLVPSKKLVSYYWIFVGTTAVISVGIILVMLLLMKL